MSGAKKLKIKTNRKSYEISDSPFYKLTTKKKLNKLLAVDTDEIKFLSEDSSYRVFVAQSSGKPRDIQQPMPRLDRLHTRIASLLCRIQPPEYLHSGVKGRTYITNAKVHIGRHSLATTDIRSFFTSTSRDQVFKFWHKVMRCSSDVAHILSVLVTYGGHIPTGSRLSMPMAFWANFELFQVLGKVSRDRSVEMTVYVDDITFSGSGVNELFLSKVLKIVASYGHVCHKEKTKLYSPDEVKLVTGVAIKGENIVVGNRQQKDIYQDMVQWIISKDHHDLPMLNDRLLGRLNAQGQIDARLKDKARTLRLAMNSKSSL